VYKVNFQISHSYVLRPVSKTKQTAPPKTALEHTHTHTHTHTEGGRVEGRERERMRMTEQFTFFSHLIFTALAEGLSWLLNTDVRWLRTICNSNSRESCTLTTHI
jgi:hypothetical protein